MLQEIWKPDLTTVFVGLAVDEVSDTLGFYYLNSGNRFWELLELGGITPERHITPSERKALTEGQARGNLSDPVRAMFIQKKTSQLLRYGVGITNLNQRVVAKNDKDKAARPADEDIQHFISKSAKLNPKILAFAIVPDLFVELFKNRYPDASSALGLQSFSIGNAEVWLLGSPATRLRGEALTAQEDAFFALGERMSALTKGSAQG